METAAFVCPHCARALKNKAGHTMHVRSCAQRAAEAPAAPVAPAPPRKTSIKNMKYIEQIDEAKLRIICANWDALVASGQLKLNSYIWDPKKELMDYIVRCDNGQAPVTYRKGSLSRGSGRWFAQKGGLQKMPRQIRHTVAAHLYRDIDMANAHPMLLDQFCEKNDIPHEALHHYVDKRDEMLRNIQESIQCDRDGAKKLMLTLTFGGDLPADMLERLPAFLQEYRANIKVIHAQLLERFPTFVEIVTKDRKKEHNVEGSVCNMVTCNLENQMLEACINFTKHVQKFSGNEALVFDGWMIPRAQLPNDEDVPPFLRACEQYVFETTGYRIRLEEKKMDELLDLSGLPVPDPREFQKQLTIPEFATCPPELLPRPNFDQPEDALFYLSCIPNIPECKQNEKIYFAAMCAVRNSAPADLLPLYKEHFLEWAKQAGHTNQPEAASKTWDKLVVREGGYSIQTLRRFATHYHGDNILLRPIRSWTEAHMLASMAPTGLKVETYVSQYVKDYPFYSHADRKKNFDVILERSPMGSGKTTALARLVKNHPEIRRVLCLSPRQTFARDLTANLNRAGLPFVCYLDADEEEHREVQSWADFHMFTCSVESLHRLQGADKYDLIVLDECESIAKQWTSSTMKELKRCARVFWDLLKDAKKVLAMDAYLGARSIEMILNITNKAQKPALLRVNTRKPFDLNRKAIEYSNHKQLTAAMCAALQRKRRCVLVSASRSRAADMIETAKKAIPDLSYKFYHSQVSDTVMKDLNQVSDAWKTPQLIAYTPSITVGVDYTCLEGNGVFDDLFVLGSPLSAPPRDLFQGTMRVRYISSGTMHFTCTTDTIGKSTKEALPLSKSAIRASFEKDRENARHIYDMDLATKDAAEWLKLVHLYNTMEDNHAKAYYRETFLYYLQESGYGTPVPADPLEDIDIEKVEPIPWDQVPDLSEEEFEDAEKRRRLKQASDIDKQAVRKWLILNRYLEPDSPLEIKQEAFNMMQSGGDLLRNAWLEVNRCPERLLEEAYYMAPWLSFIAETPLRLAKIRELCQILGLQHTHDNTQTISAELLKQNEERLRPIIKDLSQRMQLRDRRSKGAQRERSVEVALKEDIHAIFSAWSGSSFETKERKQVRASNGSRSWSYTFQAGQPLGAYIRKPAPVNEDEEDGIDEE